MFRYLKNQLIKVLGGVPTSDHNKVREELERAKSIEAERDIYKDFAESIYIYAGNYPAWKAQSEYRQCMDELGHAIAEDRAQPHPTRPELIDIYLGRIVDSFASLYEKNTPEFMQPSPHEFWDKDRLPEARGDYFLKS